MRLKAGLALIACACVLFALSGGASGAVSQGLCSWTRVAPGAGGVNIEVPASHTVIGCSASVIKANADVHGPVQYQACGPLGNSCATRTVASAISIKALLGIAGIDPTDVHLAEVVPALGTPSVVRAPASSSSSEGAGPVVEVTGSNTRYLGPVGEGTTTSSYEEISVPNGEPLELYAFSGRVLTVNVTSDSSSNSTPIGKSVQFSASPFPAGFKYRWSFGDGTALTHTDTVTHAYSARGTFLVYVTVIGPDGGAGISAAPAEVIVQPIPPKQSVTPPVTTNKGGSKSNPPSSGGASPSSGSASPSNGSGSASPSGSSGKSGTTSTTSTTPATTPVPPLSSGTTEHGYAPSSAPPSTSATPGEKSVEGRLISEVTPVPIARIAGANRGLGAPAGQAPTRFTQSGAGSLRPLAAVVGAAAIVLLLACGAARELRSLRRSIASARLG